MLAPISRRPDLHMAHSSSVTPSTRCDEREKREGSRGRERPGWNGRGEGSKIHVQEGICVSRGEKKKKNRTWVNKVERHRATQERREGETFRKVMEKIYLKGRVERKSRKLRKGAK